MGSENGKTRNVGRSSGRRVQERESGARGPGQGGAEWKTWFHFRGFSTIQQVRIGETCM